LTTQERDDIEENADLRYAGEMASGVTNGANMSGNKTS
jgi:hypothetical protein